MCDSWDVNILLIHETTTKINEYIEIRKKSVFDKKAFIKLLDNIALVLIEWTGKTYVGEQKRIEVKQAFQQFFVTIKNLITIFQDGLIKLSLLEKRFIKNVTYSGKLYRYIGSNVPDNRKITVEYNGIFVSWSKNKQSTYLENKLYGTIIRLYCEIPDDKFGIDLEGFQKYYDFYCLKHYYIARGEEREVVFPTIKETIYNLEYLQEI